MMRWLAMLALATACAHEAPPVRPCVLPAADTATCYSKCPPGTVPVLALDLFEDGERVRRCYCAEGPT